MGQWLIDLPFYFNRVLGSVRGLQGWGAADGEREFVCRVRSLWKCVPWRHGMEVTQESICILALVAGDLNGLVEKFSVCVPAVRCPYRARIVCVRSVMLYLLIFMVRAMVSTLVR